MRRNVLSIETHGRTYYFVSILTLFFSVYLLLPGPERLYAAEPLEIVVEGIEGELLENVKTALTIPDGLVEDGKVNVLWLEYFKSHINQTVQNAMEPFGYYDSQITVDIESNNNTYFRMFVHVDPGKPVRVTDVKVDVRGPGAGQRSLRKLIKEFPLHKGDVLLQEKYGDAKGALKARALAIGYLDADFKQKSILVSVKEHTARIELVLATGPRYYFGKTVFEGVTKYPERFLKRYIDYKAGEVFASQKLEKTQFNLVNSQRFKEVVVSPDKNSASDYEVPVVVHLTEGPPEHMAVGVGYGTDTGARFSIKYSDLDVFQNGSEFHSEIDISQRIQGIAAAYVMPYSEDLNSSSSVKLDLKREDIPTFKTKSVSLEFDRTHSFGHGRIGTAYVQALEEESDIASQSPKTFAVLPGIRFSQRRYDNLIRPTHGFSYNLELRGTHESMGSEFALLQLLASGNVLISLPWRLSVLSRLDLGFSLEDKPLSKLPASLRFFAGGQNSVRGYDYQSLGPENSSGQVTGGKQLSAGSIEMDRAIFSSWAAAIFYDAGNAFNSFSDVTLFQDFGVGLRYYTKVGPIRLDLARRIDTNKPGFKIQFSFGLGL